METIDYNGLRTFNQEVVCKHNRIADGRQIELSIELRGYDGQPDCQFGHFGYNFYFRTPYGVNSKKYSSVNKMKRAVETVLKRNGFEIIGWSQINSN